MSSSVKCCLEIMSIHNVIFTYQNASFENEYIAYFWDKTSEIWFWWELHIQSCIRDQRTGHTHTRINTIQIYLLTIVENYNNKNFKASVSNWEQRWTELQEPFSSALNASWQVTALWEIVNQGGRAICYTEQWKHQRLGMIVFLHNVKLLARRIMVLPLTCSFFHWVELHTVH